MPPSNTPPPSSSNPSTGQPAGFSGAPAADLGARGGGAPARRRRGPLLRRIVLSVVALGLIGAILAASLTLWGLRRFNDIAFVDVPGVEPPAEDGPTNWLLIGTDGREGIDPDAPDADAFLGEQVVGRRTDTIMLVRVDPTDQQVNLLSVPRDLWVPIAGRDSNGRINGSYNGDDGRQRLVATLAGVLEVDIHHYVEVNFVGFAEIVNSLDGVPVWFERPARDVESGLDIVEAGCHILDGSQALAFARARTYEELTDGQWQLEPTGDLGRTTRQRYFLSRLIDTATDKVGVSNLAQVDELLAVGGKNLVIEDGATLGDMVSLARVFTSLEPAAIQGHSLPVRDHRTSGGAQVLQLQEQEAQAVLELFRDDKPPAAPVTDGLDDGTGPESDQWPQGSDDEFLFEGSATSSVSETQSGYGRFGFTPSATVDGTPCS